MVGMDLHSRFENRCFPESFLKGEKQSRGENRETPLKDTITMETHHYLSHN